MNTNTFKNLKIEDVTGIDERMLMESFIYMDLANRNEQIFEIDHDSNALESVLRISDMLNFKLQNYYHVSYKSVVDWYKNKLV